MSGALMKRGVAGGRSRHAVSDSPGASSTSSPAATQDLPKEEVNIFRTLVKCYDEKRYKKAMKLAESILKKYPNHGETLSMKGIVSWYLPDKKQDAFDLAKKGLRLNLNSSTCWQILGILHRNLRDYNEAMKCFKQAAKLDPENLTLARDLATFQVHEGNFAGFLDTRRRLFYCWPGVKVHWTSFAFAHHLNGHFELAGKLLRTARNRFPPGDTDTNKWEFSELLLYEVLVLEEGGSYEAAVTLLRENDNLCDWVGYHETLGRLLLYLKRLDEAHVVYQRLCEKCPSDRVYPLCYLATAPPFRDNVIFPRPPPSSGQLEEKSAILPESVRSPDMQQQSSPSGAPPFLELSLLALRSPQSNGVLSERWPAFPGHLAFTSRERTLESDNADEGAPGRRGETFRQLRPLSETEEAHLTQWFSEKLLGGFSRSASNDVAVRLLLDFLSPHAAATGHDSTRFFFFLDILLRRKILKGSAFCVNTLKGFLIRGGSAGRAKMQSVRKLLQIYLKDVQEADELRPLPSPPELSEVQGCRHSEEKMSLVTQGALRRSCHLTILAALAGVDDFLGDYASALSLIEEAVALAPTWPELFQLRSRVYRHVGRLREAAEALCEARELDLADRYLNTRAVKAMLAIGEVEKASQMALFFSIEDNLTDMQSLALELRKGEAFRRLGNILEAQRYFYLVIDQINDIRADLYDFHWFCQRRGNFRSYLQALRMRDRIYANEYYRKATSNLVKILLTKFSSPDVYPPEQEKKLGTQLDNNVISPDNEGKNNRKPMPKHDLSIRGAAALQEAGRLVNTLRTSMGDLHPETLALAYRVAQEMQKPLLMLQCLLTLFKCAEQSVTHPILSPSLLHYLLHGHLTSTELSDEVAQQSIAALSKELLCQFFEGRDGIKKLIAAEDWRRGADQYCDLLLHGMREHRTPQRLIALMEALAATRECHENQGRLALEKFILEGSDDQVLSTAMAASTYKQCAQLWETTKQCFDKIPLSIQDKCRQRFPAADLWH